MDLVDFLRSERVLLCAFECSEQSGRVHVYKAYLIHEHKQPLDVPVYFPCNPPPCFSSTSD